MLAVWPVDVNNHPKLLFMVLIHPSSVDERGLVLCVLFLIQYHTVHTYRGSRPSASSVTKTYPQRRRDATMNNVGVTMVSHSPNGFFQNGFPLNPQQQHQQQVATFVQVPNACRRCQHGGCDIKIPDCGCLFHAVRTVD